MTIADPFENWLPFYLLAVCISILFARSLTHSHAFSMKHAFRADGMALSLNIWSKNCFAFLWLGWCLQVAFFIQLFIAAQKYSSERISGNI